LNLREDVNFAVEQKHLDKQIDYYLKMNNERIEENEGSIKLSKGMSQGQFNNYTSKVLTEDSVSHDDLEMLIILLVKRDRKMSGD